MLRWISIGVLSVALVGVGVWGYQEHQEKNAILIQAENNYQRSFHNLAYYVDLLHDKIGTVLAMNTADSLSPQLTEIWRITSEAHTEVGQLPLSLLPFNKTEEFLSNIGHFSYRTAIRGLDDEPLSDEEVKTLEKLYEHSGEIKRELRKVQYLVLENNLRWMDVQLALATQEEQQDNTIIDGFKTVEKNVKGYSEGMIHTSLNGVMEEPEESQVDITGEKIDHQQLRNKINQILSIDDGTELRITETGEGSDIGLYTVSFDQDGTYGYMDFTQKGGHLLTFMINREIGKPNISLYEGMERAGRFLQKTGYDHMEAYNSVQYQNVAVYSFAYTEDDVRIYPDAIEVKVALDNGEVIGIAARDYLTHHKERTINDPELTLEEAKNEVNPNVNIQEQSLAVIENDLGKEVLCYEFIGTLGEDTYRIYINAQDGFEERVERLKQPEVDFGSVS
ncbi:spore germination protein [Melghiribacillus thermohalophilus]|uniref:Spore germination protein n=1 Tax=Melghiribacillus thermohalophilus TaxID=1324956 RepID=A0A4V2V2M3_9BACI|nr:germination protein YpeB [Melghiribacillus thermohalophilus]TCT25595.1 spore germination protein [Melghiribacillus thermohalophilus]